MSIGLYEQLGYAKFIMKTDELTEDIKHNNNLIKKYKKRVSKL